MLPHSDPVYFHFGRFTHLLQSYLSRKCISKQMYMHKCICTANICTKINAQQVTSLPAGGYRWWLLGHYLPQLRGSVILMGRNSGGCDNYFHPYITFHLHRFASLWRRTIHISILILHHLHHIFHLCRFGLVLRNIRNRMVPNWTIFNSKWITFWRNLEHGIRTSP